MEKNFWRNIKDTGRKVTSPLKHRTVRYGLGAVLTTGVALYSLSIVTKGQQKPLEVEINCQNSTPVIEVRGNVEVPKGKIYWLVTEEVGSRRFRVLEKSNSSRWIFDEKYPGSAQPRKRYTELPVGKYNFREGKEYSFSIYSGDYSPRHTPLLDRRLHQIRKTIPAC